MGPETAKLNLCLEQMLDCVNSLDKKRFAELESKYDKLMKKTFPDGGPVALEYICMRNMLSNCLFRPTDPITQTSVYKVMMFLDKDPKKTEYKEAKQPNISKKPQPPIQYPGIRESRKRIFETLKGYEPQEGYLALTNNSINRLDPDTVIELDQHLINPPPKSNGNKRPDCPLNGKKHPTLGKKSLHPYKERMSDYIFFEWGLRLNPTEATPSLLETTANYFEKNSSRSRLKPQQKI
jgi:hypothetical protein